MNRKAVQLAIITLVLATLAGCATAPASTTEFPAVDNEGTMSRTMKTALAIGGALVVATILVNEAQDNIQGAVRSVNAP